MSNTIVEDFNKIYNILIKESFLKMEALGGEIPFYIAPYKAEKELEVREEIKALKNRLENNGIPILELNLYSIVCEIMEERGGIERRFEMETSLGKTKFMRNLQSSLNLQRTLMPAIENKIKAFPEAKIYFLTGIGLVYPYLRSHIILNNLQSITTAAPTLMFYPGDYDGHSLSLFSLSENNNYYRAFNILKLK